MRRIALLLALATLTAHAQVVPTCGLNDTRCQCKLDPAFCPRTSHANVLLTAMQVRLESI